MIWKLQISAIMDAYSVIDHLDGSTTQPSQVLVTEAGIQSVNPAFLIWQKRDKALLTLLYSTLSFTSACYGSRPKHFSRSMGQT